jgi:diaminohydroxyphosphoribosylaminopyrimidine deaminase/5-amino-6-(5-phosphoribosylamino)uracil reductase
MMRRALFHAERALGATVPNPMVGAVVVDGAGVVVGQGYHERAGQPHAEVMALDAAGARAQGATLYVTLEPCCHVGRTGPCTKRILASGISRVVAATLDPFPRVSGQGVRELREAGLVVDVGLEEAAARRLNAAYLLAQERQRPLVALKAATTRDGRIAARRDRPTVISGGAAARRTQRLRAAVDAIAVGAGTVIADDPRLTARDVYGRGRSRASVPIGAPTRRRRAGDNDCDRRRWPHRAAAARAGAPVSAAGLLDGRCARCGNLPSLLVEGGAALHRSFWEAGLVDRLHLIVAPARLGEAAVPLFDGLAVPWSRLSRVTSVPCGADMWMDADVHWDR